MAGVGTKADVLIENCTGCGKCKARCPFGAIHITSGKAVITGSACIGCMRCSRVCSAGAIFARNIT